MTADFHDVGADDVLVKIIFENLLQYRRFSALALRSNFGAASPALLRLNPLYFATQSLLIAME